MHFIEEETYEVSMPRYLNESIENYLDRILDDMKSLENQFLSCYIYVVDCLFIIFIYTITESFLFCN